PFAAVQSCLDFDGDKILALRRALRHQLDPPAPDEDEHDVGAHNLAAQHVDEIVAGLDVPFDVHEQTLGGELLLEPLIERLRKAWVISPAIVQKDLASHSLALLRPTCTRVPIGAPASACAAGKNTSEDGRRL